MGLLWCSGGEPMTRVSSVIPTIILLGRPQLLKLIEQPYNFNFYQVFGKFTIKVLFMSENLNIPDKYIYFLIIFLA